jgi:hypothetical protein
MCSMVCTEVPNQIKFVSRPHPTGSRTDFIYTVQTLGGGPLMQLLDDGHVDMVPYVLPADIDDGHAGGGRQ